MLLATKIIYEKFIFCEKYLLKMEMKRIHQVSLRTDPFRFHFKEIFRTKYKFWIIKIFLRNHLPLASGDTKGKHNKNFISSEGFYL